MSRLERKFNFGIVILLTKVSDLPKLGLKALYAHSPGHRHGDNCERNNAPCKGKSIAFYMAFALAGRIANFHNVPKAMPWAMGLLGFQPIYG